MKARGLQLRRLVVLMLGILAAWLAPVAPAGAVVIGHASQGHAYVYDAPDYDAPGRAAAQERGPPGLGYPATAHDAVGPRVRGASPRPEVITSGPTTTYAMRAQFVHMTRAAGTTLASEQADVAPLLSLARSEVAAKSGLNLGAGVTTRKINWRPNADDTNWGLTSTHLNKHMFGNSKYSLSKIDPGGNADVWRGYMQDLASRPATGTTTNGMLDIIGTFPRTGGGGNFQFGIRLSPGSDGSFDLITLLTKQ